MITQSILKPIGKGQITIPLSWRKAMGIDGKNVRAIFKGNKVIIESIGNENVDWDVQAIKLDQLNNETIQAIEDSQKNYLHGKKEAFLSHNDFWDDV